MNKARCNNDGPHNIKTVKEVNCSETYRESEDESIVTKANVITIIIPTKMMYSSYRESLVKKRLNIIRKHSNILLITITKHIIF